MANAKQQTPIEQFLAIKEDLIKDLMNVEIEMDNARAVFDEQMEDLTKRKDELRGALFGEVEIGIAKVTNEAPAPKPVSATRKAAKKTAAKRRATKKTTTASVPKKTDAGSNVERVLTAIHANPGANKQTLRGLLPELSENQLKAALGACSKKHFIENRGGSKTRPQWFAV